MLGLYEYGGYNMVGTLCLMHQREASSLWPSICGYLVI